MKNRPAPQLTGHEEKFFHDIEGGSE